MANKLSGGSLVTICQGGQVDRPLLQVLGHKRIAGSSSDRYRLLVSDGQYSNSFAMLATQMNSKISDGHLENFTIVRINKYVCNNMQGKKVIILLDLDVVTPGAEVGDKIGSPKAINPDGTVNDKQQKRSGDDTNNGSVQQPPAKKPLTSQNGQTRSSILDPRPIIGGGGGNGDASSSAQPIASLTPYQNKWTIQARVTQKSDIRKWSNSRGEGHLFSMELLDQSGEIKATAFKEQCDKFYNMIEVGKVYYISNGTLKSANKQYNNLNNDYEITFKDSTEVILCTSSAEDVPTLVFDFVKINELVNVAKDSLVDIIGVVKSCQDVTTIMSQRTQKELRKRDLMFVDQSLAEVNVTIWGSNADTFEGQNNPVVAIKSCKVSDYNGVSLSATSSSTIQINPDIPQAHSLKGWYDSEGHSAATNSLTQGGNRGSGDSTLGTNVKTLGEVKQENVGVSSDRAEYYSARATISMFQKDKALYQACTQVNDGKACNKKVIDNNGSYRCEKCGVDNDEFNWRLILSFSIVDCTESQWVNCFQEHAETILGASAQELGNYYQNDQDRYNRIFKDATFKSFNFRFRCKADNYNGETKVRHTVMSLSPVNWEEQNKKMMKELTEAGEDLPEKMKKM